MPFKFLKGLSIINNSPLVIQVNHLCWSNTLTSPNACQQGQARSVSRARNLSHLIMACMSLFFTRPRFYSSSLLHPICDFTEIFQVRAKVDHREPFKNLTGVFFNFEKPGTKCLVLTDAQCSQILIIFFICIFQTLLYSM